MVGSLVRFAIGTAEDRRSGKLGNRTFIDYSKNI